MTKEKIFQELLATEGVDPAILSYLGDLREDPTMPIEDFLESCRQLGVISEDSSSVGSNESGILTMRKVPLDNMYAERMENQYFRELFSRKKSTKDESLDGEVILALKGETPVAAIWYTDEPSVTYDGCVYLDMMYVGRNERGKRIGAKLIVEMIENCPSQRSVVTFAWSKAREFYERIGFLSTGVIHRVNHKRGVETFEHMVLPTSFDAFWRFSDGHDMAISEYVQELEVGDEVKQILLSEEDSLTIGRPSTNPFTVALYGAAKINHSNKQ